MPHKLYLLMGGIDIEQPAVLAKAEQYLPVDVCRACPGFLGSICGCDGVATLERHQTRKTANAPKDAADMSGCYCDPVIAIQMGLLTYVNQHEHAYVLTTTCTLPSLFSSPILAVVLPERIRGILPKSSHPRPYLAVTKISRYSRNVDINQYVVF